MPARFRSEGRTRRTTAMLGVALLLAAGATALPMQAATAATTASTATHAAELRLDLTTSSSRVVAGRTVLLRGALRLTGAARGTTRVEVQQRLHGVGGWRTVARPSVRADGRVELRSEPLGGSRDFRLRVRTATRTVTSRVATVVVPSAITVTATSPVTPTAGEAVVLAGTTTTPYRGARVYLQRWGAAGWITVSSSTVAKDSTYNIQAVATAGGDQSYRALLKPTSAGPGGATDAVAFTVYAWYRLTDLPVVPPVHGADHVLVGSTATIGDATFEQSLGSAQQTGESSVAAFALGGQCIRVSTTVGPAAEASGQARFRLFADDDLVSEQTLAPGASAVVTGTITGASALELRTFQLSGSGAVAWGAPEVLCAGRP